MTEIVRQGCFGQCSWFVCLPLSLVVVVIGIPYSSYVVTDEHLHQELVSHTKEHASTAHQLTQQLRYLEYQHFLLAQLMSREHQRRVQDARYYQAGEHFEPFFDEFAGDDYQREFNGCFRQYRRRLKADRAAIDAYAYSPRELAGGIPSYTVPVPRHPWHVVTRLQANAGFSMWEDYESWDAWFTDFEKRLLEQQQQ